jgi:hypothetical protein
MAEPEIHQYPVVAVVAQVALETCQPRVAAERTALFGGSHLAAAVEVGQMPTDLRALTQLL